MNITYAKGSNLIGDVAYEERATLFGRSLSRDNRTDKELLDEALKVASGADVIVAALGESSEMSGESSSRTDLDIPDVQRTLAGGLAEDRQARCTNPLHRPAADAHLGAGTCARHLERMVRWRAKRPMPWRRAVRRREPKR